MRRAFPAELLTSVHALHEAGVRVIGVRTRSDAARPSACAYFRTLTSVCSAVPASQDAAVRRRRRRSARELPPQGFTGNVVGHSYEWPWPCPSGLRRCAAESLLLQGTEPCSFNSNISFKGDYGMCSQFGSFTWLLCGHFWVFRSEVTTCEVYEISLTVKKTHKLGIINFLRCLKHYN